MKHAPLAALDQRLIALSDHWSDSGADYAELQAVTDAYNALNDRLNRFFHQHGATLDHLQLNSLYGTGVYHLIGFFTSGELNNPTHTLRSPLEVIAAFREYIAWSCRLIDTYRRVILACETSAALAGAAEIAIPADSWVYRALLSNSPLDRADAQARLCFYLQQARLMRAWFFGKTDAEIITMYSAHYVTLYHEAQDDLHRLATLRRAVRAALRKPVCADAIRLQENQHHDR